MTKLPFIIFMLATIMFGYTACFASGQFGKDCTSASLLSVMLAIISFPFFMDGEP